MAHFIHLEVSQSSRWGENERSPGKPLGNPHTGCGLSHMSHVMRKPIFAIWNNKGTDQPVHTCSLISTFVAHCLDSILHILAKSKISRL